MALPLPAFAVAIVVMFGSGERKGEIAFAQILSIRAENGDAAREKCSNGITDSLFDALVAINDWGDDTVLRIICRLRLGKPA